MSETGTETAPTTSPETGKLLKESLGSLEGSWQKFQKSPGGSAEALEDLASQTGLLVAADLAGLPEVLDAAKALDWILQTIRRRGGEINSMKRVTLERRVDGLLFALWEALQAQNGDLDSLPRYEVVSHVGSGTTSDIYKARDRETNRIVALKIMKESMLESDTAQERMRRGDRPRREGPLPERGPSLRVRDAGRPAVLRDGVRPRPAPFRGARSSRAASRVRSDGDRPRRAEGARGRPPGGHRPPRPEAREPDAHPRGPDRRPRLRRRAHARRPAPHPGQQHRRDPGVHGPRGHLRGGDGCLLRRLFLRVPPLQDADRPPPLRGRGGHRGGHEAHQGDAPAGPGAEPRDQPGDGRGHRSLPGQEAPPPATRTPRSCRRRSATST